MKNVIGQHMLIGLSGQTLTESEKKFIVQNNIAGVVLFGRNVVEPKQIHSLCKELQNLRRQMIDRAPLFIAIDMEGGRVARLKSPFTQWSSLRSLGDLDSPSASFNFAYFMGMELKAVGINLNFAPCIDVLTNSKNIVIGDRSIGSDPALVDKHASALVRGYMKGDVIPCVKHFPGHGNTLVDSHEDLPVEESDLARLNEIELIPFKKAFRSRVQMMMTAHIKFKKIDPEWPVTLSEVFLKKIVRQELRYKGLIITDDLDMKAMINHYERDKISVRALYAGADLLLYCNEPESPPKAIEAIERAIQEGHLKLSDLENTKRKILSMKKECILNPDPMDFEEAIKMIGHPDHFKLAQAIASGNVPAGLVGT